MCFAWHVSLAKSMAPLYFTDSANPCLTTPASVLLQPGKEKEHWDQLLKELEQYQKKQPGLFVAWDSTGKKTPGGMCCTLRRSM